MSFGLGRRGEDTQTEREMPCDATWKDKRFQWCSYMPRMPEIVSSCRSWREAQNRFSLGTPKRINPTNNTLISDSGLQNFWNYDGINSIVLTQPVCGNALWLPQENKYYFYDCFKNFFFFVFGVLQLHCAISNCGSFWFLLPGTYWMTSGFPFF